MTADFAMAARKAALHFDAELVDRGRVLAEQGRVKLRNADWPFVAQVFDGAGAVVTVYYSREAELVRGECDCAVGFDCVHVVAALIAVMARAGQLEELRWQQHQQRSVANWLAQFAQRADPLVGFVDERQVVVYVLARAQGQLGLTVQQSRRLVRGGFGRSHIISSVADPGRGVPLWIQPEDLRLIMLAHAVSRTRGNNVLDVDRMDAMLFAELAKTGRLFWDNVGTRPLALAPARQMLLRWRVDDRGKTRPDGAVDYVTGLEPGLVLVPAMEPHVIDLVAATIAPVELDIGAGVVQQLAHAPPVPRAMLATALRSLRPLMGERAAAALAELPDGEPIESDTGPAPLRPHLRVFMSDDPQLDALQVHAEAGYGEVRFPLAGWEPEPVVTRDLIAEGVYLDRLEWLLRDRRDRHPTNRALDDLAKARHLVQHVVPVLRDEGWSCDVDGAVPAEPVANADDWIATLSPHTSQDAWFHFAVDVVIAGRTVPLLPILLEAIRGGRLPLETGLLESEHVNGMNVTLPDGDMVYVPGERLKTWARPLVELSLRGLDDDDKLLVPAFTAVELAEQLASAAGSRAGEFGHAELLEEARTQLAALIDLPAQREGPGFAGELRSYQRQGLAWLKFLHDARYGGLLADDMGLGKTVQVIAFFAALQAQQQLSDRAPALVVAPRSVIDHWRAEIERFAPALRPLVHIGPGRARTPGGLGEHSVVITSYQTMLRDERWLAEVSWTTVVFDEAQALKNPGSRLRKAAARLRGHSRFAITGTPIENHLTELWSQLDLVMPGLLGRRSTFDSVLRRPIEKYGVDHLLEFLRQRIRPFMLRRTKAGVDLELPDKTEIIERITLASGQRDLYESLRLSLDEDVRRALREKNVKGSSLVVLDAILKLRQCCCDPRLVDLPQAQQVRSSAKLERLMSMLEELADSGRYVLVFSQFTSMLELIEAECRRAEISYLKLTGATRNREQVIRAFQAGEAPVFLISLKAGGVGLNLTRADTVVHYDPWWNPAAEQQATDRAHRIGQDKHVFVYKLVARNTLEERIAELQEAKRALSAAALHRGGAAHLVTDDLGALYHQLV